MKKTIFKKLYIDTAGFFLTFLLIMSLIVWTLQAVNYFDFVTEDGQIVAYNSNGTLVNGFPIGVNYHGILLILSESIFGQIFMISTPNFIMNNIIMLINA